MLGLEKSQYEGSERVKLSPITVKPMGFDDLPFIASH